MSGSCREALSNVRELSGCPPGCLGVVREPSRMSLWGRRPFQMSGSSREAHPNMREALPVV